MATREILEDFEPAPSNLVIGRILNRGSYGVIHWGMLGGEPVAVKRIHRIFLEADVQGREHLLRAFKNECRFLKSLNHPNVVKFMGAYRDKEGPLLIMELMKESLEEFLKRKRGNLSLRRQLDICLSIAKGLAALHNREESILHRDLTDRNVLLTEDGTVKIADFGQSKMVNKPAQDLMSTQPGAVTYMPPEVLEHEPRYTSSIDTFSLGVLMLEIATQQPPQVGLTDIGKKREIIRRAVDLKKLPNGHWLKPLILWCLQECDCRPAVATICCQISILRDNVMMKEKEVSPDERRELEDLRKKESEIQRLQREKESEIQRLQREKDRKIQRLQESIRELRGENHTQDEKNRLLSLQVSQLQREKDSEMQRLQESIREFRGENHTQDEKNRQLSLQVSQLQREKDSEMQRLQKRLSDAEKAKERLKEENLADKQIIQQYRIDFDAERKDREAAAGIFADREKEWMEQIRRAEENNLKYQHDERLRQENQTLRAERLHLLQTTQELQATQNTCKKLSAEKENLEYQMATLLTATQHNEKLRQENRSLKAELKDARQCSLKTTQDLQEQIEEQKREINQLNHKLRNRQQDVGKSMSRYTTHKRLYDRNEQEHQSTTAMKAETITSQRIQKLEQENQTLKTQVEDTRQALQDKENLCQVLQAENKDLRSKLKYKNTWTGWAGTFFGSS